MKKRILVIMGHPGTQSFCASLADAYVQGATDAGHAVQRIDVRDLVFDPILHEGYRQIQALEPDLQAAQQALKEADHLVFIYPTWWGGMPALLKGFFERVLLPGFAFKYRANSVWWDKYLTGKSAHVLTTMDTPPWYFRLFYRNPGNNQIRRTILEFCGIRPVRITCIGRVHNAPASWTARWLDKAAAFGRRA